MYSHFYPILRRVFLKVCIYANNIKRLTDNPLLHLQIAARHVSLDSILACVHPARAVVKEHLHDSTLEDSKIGVGACQLCRWFASFSRVLRDHSIRTFVLQGCFLWSGEVEHGERRNEEERGGQLYDPT